MTLQNPLSYFQAKTPHVWGVTLLRFFIICLLLSLIIISLFPIVRYLLNGTAEGEFIVPMNNNLPDTQVTGDMSPESFPSLFGNDQFGAVNSQAFQTNTQVPANKTNKPSSVNLTLKGIIGSTGRHGALAILNIKGGSAEDAVFAVGDSLPGNSVLAEIRFDRVNVRQGLTDTVLMLRGEESEHVNNKKNVPRKIQLPKAPNRVPKVFRRNIPRQFLSSTMADLPALSKEIAVQVQNDGGSQQGYRLISLGKGSLLVNLGLHSGDVITEINGLKLNNLRQSLMALNQIREAKVLRVIALRHGEEKSFVYTVK